MYTILFADDTDIEREFFSEALRRAGYHVLEAENGAKALSGALHSGAINLLITEILMPHLSGPQLWRALRASHRETSVLFISAYAGDGVDFEGPFLQKPFTPDTLLARVADILHMSGAPPTLASPASAF